MPSIRQEAQPGTRILKIVITAIMTVTLLVVQIPLINHKSIPEAKANPAVLAAGGAMAFGTFLLASGIFVGGTTEEQYDARSTEIYSQVLENVGENASTNEMIAMAAFFSQAQQSGSLALSAASFYEKAILDAISSLGAEPIAATNELSANITYDLTAVLPAGISAEMVAGATETYKSIWASGAYYDPTLTTAYYAPPAAYQYSNVALQIDSISLQGTPYYQAYYENDKISDIAGLQLKITGTDISTLQAKYTMVAGGTSPVMNPYGLYYWNGNTSYPTKKWCINYWSSGQIGNSITTSTWNNVPYRNTSYQGLTVQSIDAIRFNSSIPTISLTNGSTILTWSSTSQTWRNTSTGQDICPDAVWDKLGNLEGSPIDVWEDPTQYDLLGPDVRVGSDGSISDTGNIDILRPTTQELQDGLTYPDILERTDATVTDGAQAISDARVWDPATSTWSTTFPTIQDLINEGTMTSTLENINIGNRQFAGLSSFCEKFPFCVPFDLIHIFSIFSAEKETPVFELVYPTLNGETIPFTIDLTPFDPVAAVVRTMNMILFIVSLIVLTRNIIKG